MESVNGQACDRCHRRKTRCDKRRSACTACKNANTTCTYSARPKEPVYRRDYVERLERRARQLESNNRALHEQISQANQVSSPASHVREIGNISQPSMPPPDAMVESCQEAADTVSFLSTHAGSDRQFLGSASGLYLASLIRASIQQPTNASCVAHENRSSKGAAWSTDHNALPPRQMAKSLIDAYLAHDALCYPIVHPKQVSAAVENIYANAGQNRISPFHGFVFNMLLAIATAQVYKFHWQVLPDAETHHQRAMAYLDSVLSAGGLHGLQAMLLSCQFRLSSSTKDASGSLWHMVGVASRMCFELGLHRESTYSFGPASLRRGEDELLSISELEQIHRQCFWCVFCLDRVVSITLGRPLAVHLEDTDVALPSAPIEEREEEVVSPQSNGSRDSLRIEPSYRMAVFAHIIRYRALCGKILITLHRGRRGATPPLNERIAKRNELAAELEAWRVDTAFLKLPEMDLSIPLAEARSSFRSEAWYELLYQNGVLLLYRPSPSNASSGTQDEDNSVRNTHAAAKQSITLYGYLFQSRKINFSWITLHAVFLAGLSYVHAVSQHLRETRKQRNGIVQTSPRLLLTQNPTIMDIVNDTRACSNVLVAVSERCNAPKNTREVFDRLSDAMLADAVELYTNPCQVSQCSQAANTTSTSTVSLNPGIPPVVRTSEQDLLLTVDSTLIDCMPDLGFMSDVPWGHDAIHQLSKEWLDGLDVNNEFAMNASERSYNCNLWAG